MQHLQRAFHFQIIINLAVKRVFCYNHSVALKLDAAPVQERNGSIFAQCTVIGVWEIWMPMAAVPCVPFGVTCVPCQNIQCIIS